LVNAGTLWTGTLTFDLLDAAAQRAWRLSVVLRRELVSFWDGPRNLAMIDREQLRAWADNPAMPLEGHDITLACLRDWIAVAVDDGPPAWLAPDGSTRLRAVL
jgi:hypothetical protein